MNLSSDEIEGLLKGTRKPEVDWLSADTPVTTIAQTMAAMANSQGGRLFLGVNRPAEIAGISDGPTAIDLVLQAALTIEPPLIISVPRIVPVGKKAVAVVHIPPGMPHVYSLDGRYLHRAGSENVALKHRELRRLLIERGELSFETEIAQGARVDDLDWDKATAYVQSLGGLGDSSVEDGLLKRGCLAEQDGELRPTNAGILLFGKDPQRHIRGPEITAVRFAGGTMSDTFSRQDITGTLPDQIKRVETFLVDHLRKDVQLKQTMARQEQFEYPMEAARELVINAVAHRNYSIGGDCIRLFIFIDRMEVHSPGGLPGPVTVANIKDERFSRNPVIVQVLSDMGYIERLGYGVDRVIELMREQGLRAPAFQERAGGFHVTLHNQDTQPPEEAAKLDSEQPETAVSFHGVYKDIAINPRQEIALVHLHSGNTRITNSELKQLCPDVHPETIRRDLAALVTKNILRKMGEKRGSYYVLSRDTD